MTRKEAIDKVYGMSGTKEQHEALEFLIPEVRELREFYERQSEDERIRKQLVDIVAFIPEANFKSASREDCRTYLEKQKEEEGYEAIPVESTLEYKLGFKAGKESEKQKEPHYSPLCNTIKDKIREYIANHFIADTVVKTDMRSIVKAMEEGVRLGEEKQKETSINWMKSDNVKNPDKPYIDKAGMFYTTDGKMCYTSEIEKQKDLTTENIYKHSRERMSFWNGQQKEQKPVRNLEIPAENESVVETADSELEKELNTFLCGYDREINEEEIATLTNVAEHFYQLGKQEQKSVDYDHEMWKNCEANFKGGKKEVIEHPERYGLTKQKPVEKPDLVAELKHHLATTPKEQLEKEWKELERWNNIGPTVQEFLYGKSVEWSEEDKEMLLSIINAFRNGTVSTIGQEQWLKALPERFNLQPKQEWSEEDKGILLSIKCVIDSVWHNFDYDCSKEELKEMWNWLDALWQKVEYPKPKQEWSEEQLKKL